MEPRIQYAKTKDGVSIAFYTVGKGMPIVEMVSPTSIQYDWPNPETRRWIERMEGRQLVRFDSRGTGLSDRDVGDFSLDALMLDVEAVVKRLDLGRLALFGTTLYGPLAISYAVQHPERVSHLMLLNSVSRASDFTGTPQAQGILALLDKDWQLFTETLAHALYGWSEGESAQRYAAEMRESVTPEYLRAWLAAFADVDVTHLLPRVRCETLVLYEQQLQGYRSDWAKGLASRIADARLVPLEKGWVLASPDGLERIATTIDEFLGDGEEGEAGAEPLAKEYVHTILFTDMEGSTALAERLGDARAQELLRRHNRIVRDAINAQGGTEIKHTGDGIMVSFSSATKALECAIAMQRAFARHNEGAEVPIMVRVGLNAGEPIAEDDDLFGTAVNLAARIAAKAEGGEILTSDTVRGLVAGKKFLFSDRGETAMRGFEDPVHVYELRWQD